jgi:hypothetical protein
MTLVNATTGEVVSTLEDLEVVIERGLSSFVEVGSALMQIRDERLYRAEHDTFEDYCRERWGFGRTYAHRVIESAEVVSLLPMVNTPMPASERQARALRPLKAEPEKMAEAMTRAAEVTGGKPTAEAISEAVADLMASTEQKRQDKAELKALMDELQPPDFDPVENGDAVRQRGEFARLCRDLRNLPAPADFLARHGKALRDRHHTYAREAHAWLTTYLKEIR